MNFGGYIRIVVLSPPLGPCHWGVPFAVARPQGASCVGARLLTGEFPPRDLGISGICARFQLQVVTGEADVARHFQGFVFLEALVGVGRELE